MSDPVQPAKVTRVSLPVTLICDVPVRADEAAAFLQKHLVDSEDGYTIPSSGMPAGFQHVRLYPDQHISDNFLVEDIR